MFIAAERGSASGSLKARCMEGICGVHGVTALIGSSFIGVVGDIDPSGAVFSLSNSAANHVWRIQV